MAANLELLIPTFKTKVDQLLRTCMSNGFEMRPSTTRRDAREQARLWRQSRSIEEIETKIAELDRAGAHFLATCIGDVGPQAGIHVTNALPGFSWHQWDEALDCFWVVDGKAEWSTQKLVKGNNGYHIFAEAAEAIGLTAGGKWPKFKDWPHVQLRSSASPAKEMSLLEIEDAMRKRFDH